jgi:disulfide bond formation protein DsbB
MSPSLRQTNAAALILALAVIVYVLFAQYVQGYQPCELCWRERWPWYAIIGFGIAGTIVPSRLWLLMIAAALVVGTGLGLHHVGVELHWWAGPSACTSDSAGAKTVAELRAMMMRQTQVVQCDAPTWFFLGLSMATWNFITALVAAIAAITLLIRSRHVHPS